METLPVGHFGGQSLWRSDTNERQIFIVQLLGLVRYFGIGRNLEWTPTQYTRLCSDHFMAVVSTV